MILQKNDRNTIKKFVAKYFKDNLAYIREKDAYKTLDHDHIVPEFYCDDKNHIIFLEEHITFIDWWNDPKVTPMMKKRVVEQIRRILGCLKYNGVMHNDFHAGNIVIRKEDYEPYLIDFEWCIFKDEKKYDENIDEERFENSTASKIEFKMFLGDEYYA